MNKKILSIALGCSLAMSALNAQQYSNLMLDQQSHVVVGEEHYNDMVFCVNGFEGNAPDVTFDITAEQPKVYTHGYVRVNLSVSLSDIQQGVSKYVGFPMDMEIVGDDYGVKYHVYSYNSAVRANLGSHNDAWQEITPTNGKMILKAGKGYRLVFSNNVSEAFTIEFKSIMHNFVSNDCRTTGMKTTFQSFVGNVGEEHNHIQLISEPFMSAARLNTSGIRVAIPNANGGVDQYISDDPSLPLLEPWQGFFIQNYGDIQFKGEHNRNLVMAQEQHMVVDEFLSIYLYGPEGSDKTVLWFSESASTSYDVRADFAKWLTGEEKNPIVYSLESGHKLAYNQLPWRNERTIPLGVKVAAKGNVTFSLDGKQTIASQVVLHDKLLNRYTDLKLRDYTFTAYEGVDETRFEINIQFTPTTTPEIDGEGTVEVFTSNRGIILEGVVEGSTIQLVDASGKIISYLIAGTNKVVLPQLVPGVYMVMVNTNGNVNGYKLTVK